MKKQTINKMVELIENGLKEYKYLVLFTQFVGCATVEKILLKDNTLYVYRDKKEVEENWYLSFKLSNFKNVNMNGNYIYLV